MNRLGLLPPSTFEASQKEVYQVFEKQNEEQPLSSIYSRDEDGCLLGPAGVLIHDPMMFQHSCGLEKALRQKISQAGLPRYVLELVSLVVGARTKAVYEIFAHSRSSGFPQGFLDDIRHGHCPPELGEKGEIAFEVATELGKPGSLSEAIWEKSVGILGVEGTAALIQCVGFYTFLSTISNGFDVQIPTALNSPRSSRSERSSIFSDVDD